MKAFIIVLQLLIFICQTILVILHVFDPFNTFNEYDVEIILCGFIALGLRFIYVSI